MKKLIVIVLAGMMISLSGMAQDSSAPKDSTKQRLEKCIDVAVGYVPKEELQAFRASAAWNNIVLKRFGVFSAVEMNGGNDYFSHIVGITGSVTSFAYLYAGMDVFSKNGLFKNGFDSRKNFGLGIYPFDWAVVKIGYSFSVGPTAEIGIRIP